MAPLNPALGSSPLSSASINAEGKLSIDCTCDGKGESARDRVERCPCRDEVVAVSLWHNRSGSGEGRTAGPTTSRPNQRGWHRNRQESARSGSTIVARPSIRCAPRGRAKTYHITVFALKDKVHIAPDQASRANLLPAIKNLVLAEGTLDFNTNGREHNEIPISLVATFARTWVDARSCPRSGERGYYSLRSGFFRERGRTTSSTSWSS